MAFDFRNIFKSVTKSVADTPKRVVGIDFGSASVKVVELEQRDNFVALKTYGELQLGPYAEKPLGSVSVLSLEKRTEALVDVIREAGVKSDHGVLALPLASSFVTVIDIKAKASEDLNPRVQAEARKYIPVPLSEVALEWTELPVGKKADQDYRQALIAAVQNTSYQEMYQLLTNVSLASQPTEIEIFCTQRAITTEENGSGTVVIIDFGAQTTKLYIIKEGLIRKIHRVFAGGAQVTKELAKTLETTFEEAENIKRETDDAKTEEQKQAIRTIVNEQYTRALQEFRRVIQEFQLHNEDVVEAVHLSGGAASLPEVSILARQILEKEIVVAHPFGKVAYPAFMEDVLQTISPTFAVALGAALRSFE